MDGNQSKIAPIMSKGDNVYSFGNNAYGKPATALWILRETIMGPELFDHAFQNLFTKMDVQASYSCRFL